MDVRILEEYLNLYAKHLAENDIKTVLDKIKQVHVQDLSELRKRLQKNF